ncbi:MAG TPA: serine/threonine-protein kinase [Tepidisphaeraceae bacterium]|nr:serine/threonine-protein kinase [Tepidisphaeraceae bacterium]
MPTAGQRVGEYVLQDRISAGTFGEVWRANHHVWRDQVVAIKIPTDPQYLRNLQREGVAVHGLTHPNVVRAIGFDPYADPPYLTMEYVPGSSLRPLIQNRSVKVRDAVHVMRQVLAGLSHAHGLGLVHRDVKPENILVHERAFREGFGAEGVIKVADFGLGRAAAATQAGSIAYSASLDTAAGREIAGTLDYMAPEQRAGQPVDARADLYACGVVLYELLTGERPAGTDVPSDLNPAVPKHLDGVFRRSYARLEKRYATADEFAKALAAATPPPIPKSPPVPQDGAVDFRGSTRYVPVPPVPGAPANTRAIAHAAGHASCPQCRQAVDTHDQFCMHCGIQLVENVRRCPQCGAYPDGSDQYCIFCGQTLTTHLAGV